MSFAHQHSVPARCKTTRGFSLTELAIVLGVMGIVIGALWGVVGIVRENMKRQEISSQVSVVVNKVRDFYISRTRVVNLANLPTYDAVTDYLIRENIIPSEMVRDRTAAGLLRADHPWGAVGADGVLIANGGFAIAGGGDPTDSFVIQLRGLGQASCIALSDKLTGANMPLGLERFTINAVAPFLAFPVSPDAAAVPCNNVVNTLTLQFRLRHQVTH